MSLLMVCVALSLLSGRLIQLQGLDASTYAEMARDSRTQVVTVPALRGPILDRNGEPLAQSVEAYDVVVDQRLVHDHGNPAAYALQLEGLLTDDAATLQRKLTGDRRYRVLERNVSPETWREISGLGLTGIFSEPTAERFYPAGAVAGNVVGFVGAESTGLAGLEQSLQSQLAGSDGELVYQVAGGGVRIPLGSGSREDAVAGQGVRLTIDRDIQWYAEQVLAAQVTAAKAAGGNVVVMDTRTGELVAMATAPGLDPTDPASPSDPASSSGPGGGNRVVETAYEPGSVLKPMSLAAVVEEGLAEPASVFSVPDRIERENLTIRDHYRHPQEQMTLAGILANSSNVGTILASEQLSPADFGGYLSRFGLGVRPGLGLPAETAGRLPGEWSSLDRDFASFGQGISVNTVQLASAYATLANGGVRMPPRLIDATVDAGGHETEVPAGQPERVVSQETADAVTAMLEAVMVEGTGRSITVNGYRIAGKTGTAQAIDPACGCYNGIVDVSFIGYAPAEDPRYVVAVSIFDPKRGRSGGGLGGPVFADVMGFTLHRMGVPPSDSEPPELAIYAD